MMHKAWSRLVEVLYCFWRSSVKFQGHTAKKIVDFYPNSQEFNCRPGPCEGVADAMSASRVVCKVVQVTIKQRQLHANICNGDAS